MTNDIDNGISDEILNKAQADLADYLDKNNIPKTPKMILEMQGYILMVLSNDHKKVGRMYTVYKKQETRRAWWEKFQWVLIPIITGGIVAFFWQALYFWIDIAPKLSRLP